MAKLCSYDRSHEILAEPSSSCSAAMFYATYVKRDLWPPMQKKRPSPLSVSLYASQLARSVRRESAGRGEIEDCPFLPHRARWLSRSLHRFAPVERTQYAF